MNRKKGNADLPVFRTGPSGTTLERINSSVRHHLAGGPRHSLRGRYYSHETGCQTRSVGILIDFLPPCRSRPESSRIRSVRLFCYENHVAGHVKKLSINECIGRLDRQSKFESCNSNVRCLKSFCSLGSGTKCFAVEELPSGSSSVFDVRLPVKTGIWKRSRMINKEASVCGDKEPVLIDAEPGPAGVPVPSPKPPPATDLWPSS